MAEDKDPFYVGYLPLPTSLNFFVKAIIGASVLGAIALAFVIAPRQQDPGSGSLDASKTFAIEGHLSIEPYPIVYVADPESAARVRGMLLVSSFKFGAWDRVADLHGKRVRSQGEFISREGRGMFQLIDGEDAVVVLSDASTPPAIESLGDHTLIGEITDAKCFLGVMKPGFGKTHRACAVRCISGGIQPVFVTRDVEGKATVYLLTDANHGAINDDVLSYVAEPVELTGRLERHGDLLVYAIDPSKIVRK
jgi:hypothetical protein